MSPDIYNLLKNKFNFSDSDFKSSILNCKEIINKLNELKNNPNKFNIIKIENYLRFFDFSKKILDIFVYGNRIKNENHNYQFEHFISANFRSIFSSFLTFFSAIMLHCSGLIMKTGAVLFFAPNEGGKSTLVILSKNKFPILNDDQVILKKENGIIFAHGTPFGAFSFGQIKAKVAGHFVLEQADSFRIEKISPQEFIQCIWNEHLRYTYFLPIEYKKIAFNILFDAFLQAPIYRLFFTKNSINWDEIEEAIKINIS